MNTTQIFVEQVIIGFIFLITLLLPLYPQIGPVASAAQNLGIVEHISVGALIVGIAYLLGIVFDRFADSLLGVLDQHHRLRVALKGVNLRDSRFGIGWSDPFPEDAIRVQALTGDDGLGKWIDYLRIRMRLARALAVFLPALTFSAVVALVRHGYGKDCAFVTMDDVFYVCRYIRPWCAKVACDDLGTVSVTFLVLIYAGAAVVQRMFAWFDPVNVCANPSDRSCIDNARVRRFVFGTWSPPRTDREAARNYARSRRLEKPTDGDPAPRWVFWDIVLNPLIWAWLVLAYVTWRFAAEVTSHPAPLLAGLGLGLTVLSGWAWWRTTQTYMAYLKIYGKSAATK